MDRRGKLRQSSGEAELCESSGEAELCQSSGVAKLWQHSERANLRESCEGASQLTAVPLDRCAVATPRAPVRPQPPKVLRSC